jgi:hypothetical protein
LRLSLLRLGDAKEAVKWNFAVPFDEEPRPRQGTVFDAQGSPLLIIPHRPFKSEFDDIAIETIKTWKAQPATMQGKPVAVYHQLR